MKIYVNRFEDFETLSFKEKKKFKTSELLVKTVEGFVPMLDLFVVTKENKDGTVETRHVKSVADFQKNLEKNNVFLRDNGEGQLDSLSSPIFYENITIPKTVDSFSVDKSGATDMEKVPYGLKRTLTVAEAGTGDGEYLYVFTDGKGKFLSKEKIFWYEGLEKKTYLEAISEGKDLSTIEFVDDLDHVIDGMYTEHEFKFDGVLAHEKTNLTAITDSVDHIEPFSKKTYSIDKNNNVVYTTTGVDRFLSDQKFVVQKVEDEKNPKKQKNVSKISAKNFVATPTGEYTAVTVNKKIRIVKTSDLVDAENNEIEDISKMVGKIVKFHEDDAEITCDPLTYEQANLKYDAIKTIQESDTAASESSCLKLKNGSFVNEMSCVQPISYKLTSDDAVDFDKYLVPQKEGDVIKYVVIDRDYVEKRGSASGLDLSKAKKVVRCDFNDKNCVAVQKTSKKQNIEQCSLIRKVKFGDETIEPEQSSVDAYAAFKSEYVAGNYQIQDIYIDGERHEIIDNKRYEYTDETYHEDYASNLHQYRAMRTNDISIKDGKIIGGAKYDVFKGIGSAYSVWFKALIAGVTVVPAAGIFGLLAVPLVSAYAVGVVAAAPIIPLVNIGMGIAKNNSLRKVLKYKDKTEYNRKKEADVIVSRLENVLANSRHLSQTEFDAIFLKRMNEIAMFGKTTDNNSLVVVDGKAEVNSGNANLANEYIAEYKKAKNDFDIYQRRIDALTRAGKPIPEYLQKEYDIRKAKLESLKNTVRGQSYGIDPKLDNLLNRAAAVRLCAYLENYPDADLVSGLSDELKSKLSYDYKLGLAIDNISIYADEKAIAKKFDNDPSKIAAWNALKEEALNALEQAKITSVEEPIVGDVETKLDAVQRLNELVKECELDFNSITEIVKDYAENFVIMNNSQLLSQAILDDIYALAEVEDIYSVEEVERKIEEIILKRDVIKEHLSNATAAKTKIDEIETIMTEIGKLSEKLTAICDSLNGGEKDILIAELQGYIHIIETAYNDFKMQDNIADLDIQANIITENKTKLEEMLERITILDANSAKIKISEEINMLYTQAIVAIESLDSTEVKHQLPSVISVFNNNKRFIKEFENEVQLDATSVKDAVKMKNKSTRIVQLIQIGVDVLMVFEKVKKFAKAETQSYVGRLIGELVKFIRVNKGMTIAELQENVRAAKDMYEREFLPFLVEIEEKEEKDRIKAEEKERKKAKEKDDKKHASPKIDYDTKINSEDRLVVLLKAKPQSKDRKKLIEYIRSESGVEITEDDILETIKRIDEKHLQSKNATANSARLANKNINIILTYGQEYLTMFAEEIKKRVELSYT